jgi:hypothetical protein
MFVLPRSRHSLLACSNHELVLMQLSHGPRLASDSSETNGVGRRPAVLGYCANDDRQGGIELMTGRHALSIPAGLSEQSARAFPGWNDRRCKIARRRVGTSRRFLRLKGAADQYQRAMRRHSPSPIKHAQLHTTGEDRNSAGANMNIHNSAASNA